MLAQILTVFTQAYKGHIGSIFITEQQRNISGHNFKPYKSVIAYVKQPRYHIKNNPRIF